MHDDGVSVSKTMRDLYGRCPDGVHSSSNWISMLRLSFSSEQLQTDAWRDTMCRPTVPPQVCGEIESCRYAASPSTDSPPMLRGDGQTMTQRSRSQVLLSWPHALSGIRDSRVCCGLDSGMGIVHVPRSLSLLQDRNASISNGCGSTNAPSRLNRTCSRHEIRIFGSDSVVANPSAPENPCIGQSSDGSCLLRGISR